jgi:hypothetical protein
MMPGKVYTTSVTVEKPRRRPFCQVIALPGSQQACRRRNEKQWFDIGQDSGCIEAHHFRLVSFYATNSWEVRPQGFLACTIVDCARDNATCKPAAGYERKIRCIVSYPAFPV